MTSPSPDSIASLPARLTLEFTIEPFVEGRPGPHVQAAFDAAQAQVAAGAEVEIGPFGTTVSGSASVVLGCSDAVLTAAFAAGASRVSLQISTA